MSFYTKLSGRMQLLSLGVGTLVFLCLCACFHDYYTKGEPREALVAVEMLRTGNWILPIDGSGDMSYKPPMLHWLICLFSLPGGEVTVFTSRLPSILALTMLVVSTYLYVKKSRESDMRRWQPLLAALILLTSFEVIRAGVNCRVDMLLSAFMAIAMMLLWRGGVKAYAGAVVCMSAAMLTKGPVGVFLPLFLWWIWQLWGKGWKQAWRPTLVAVVLGVCAIVLPAVWYIAAYCQGGERFLSLVMEENFGRLAGTMSYESHVKPFWYNFVMLASGLLPWSGATLLSLLLRPWRRKGMLEYKRNSQAFYSLVIVVGVLLFFTMPASKRSVYLLPLYPFAAVWLADYARRLTAGRFDAGSAGMRIAGFSLGVYALIYMVAWPAIVNARSDRHVAAQVEKVSGHAPLYTIIHSRLDRFYGVDYYLGVRLRSLVASGQVAGSKPFSLEEIKWPEDKRYSILMPLADWQADSVSLADRLSEQGCRVRHVYTSEKATRDMRQPLVVLNVEQP